MPEEYKVVALEGNVLKMCQKLKACKWIMLYLILTGLLVLAISQKQYFYFDEYFEYSIANTRCDVVQFFTNAVIPRDLVYDNIKYTPASGFYAKLTSVSPKGRFNYATIRKNLKHEFTPPLHYCLTHTVCSIFPGIFSKWFAGIINIVFALFILFVARLLLRQFTYDSNIINVISLVLVCSSALINAATLFRAYIMAMFFVTLQAYLLTKQLGKPITKKFCLQLFTATLLGTLTHYYCALYAVLGSVLFGIMLLKEKNWNGFAKFSGAQLMAGISACAIFPPIFLNVWHLGLQSQNAAQAMGISFTEVVSYSELLCFYIALINERLFGGTLFFIVPVILFFGIYVYTAKDKNKVLANDIVVLRRRYIYILVSVVCYCILVTMKNMRISYAIINLDFRYLQPVWILILSGTLVYLFVNIKKHFTKVEKYIIPVIALLITIGSWHYTNWNEAFMYKGYNAYAKIREPYYGADCICITGDTISSYTAYELQPYRSLTWIKATKFQPQLLRDLAKGSKLVICVEAPDAQADAIFLELMKYLPAFEAKFKSPLYANHPDFERPGNIYCLDRVAN